MMLAKCISDEGHGGRMKRYVTENHFYEVVEDSVYFQPGEGNIIGIRLGPGRVGQFPERYFNLIRNPTIEQQLLSKCRNSAGLAGSYSDRRDRANFLVNWCARYARGEANPKWLEEYAFELAAIVAGARNL